MWSRPVVLAASLGALALAAPAVANAKTVISFKEIDKGSTFTFVDNAPKAANPRRPTISAGDLFVISIPLQNTRGESAGTLRAQCTFTKGTKNPNRGGEAVCYGVFSFTNGTIDVLVGTRDINSTKTTGGVVGGTGAYAGARGTFTSVTGKTSNSDTITLLD